MTSLATEPPGMLARLRDLARMRIVQFLAIGGTIFLLAPPTRDDHRIEVSRRELAIVDAAEAARHGTRALDAAKAAEVEARLIEDKLLFAEGVRLGLDQDDPMIRQRVVQKVLLLAEDLGGGGIAPRDAELRAAYARDAERYRRPPRYHVMQVFSARAGDLPPAEALDPAGLPAAGEPFPLPREARATLDELRRSYGAGFGDAVARLAPSAGYSAPIASSFGWHRVRVVEIEPGRIQPFEEVAHQVGFDLALARREATVRRFLDDTAARYQIVVDGVAMPRFTPTLRLARREAASGED